MDAPKLSQAVTNALDSTQCALAATASALDLASPAPQRLDSGSTTRSSSLQPTVFETL